MAGFDTEEELLHLLSQSLQRVGKGAILISGLDSTILAHLIPNSSLYTFGLVGSYDMETAKMRTVGERKLHSIILSDEDLFRGLEELDRYDLSIVEVSFILPFAVIGDRIPEQKLITGHGADELFGGYLKYFDSKRASDEKSAEILMEGDLRILERKHIPIIRELLGRRKKLIVPYLDAEVKALARNIPIQLRLKERKHILKRAGSLLSIEGEMEKRALQYSSGVMKWLKKKGRTRHESL